MPSSQGRKVFIPTKLESKSQISIESEPQISMKLEFKSHESPPKITNLKAEKLGNGFSLADLHGKVSVVVFSETFVLDIAVRYFVVDPSYK